MNPKSHQVNLDLMVKQTIEEVTGNQLKDIRHDSDLIEDLGITRAELAKIITTTQDKLEIFLSENAKREILEEVQDVSDLIAIFEEEYEF